MYDNPALLVRFFFFSLTFRRDIVDIPHTSSFAFMEQIKLVLHEIPHLSQVNCDGKENSLSFGVGCVFYPGSPPMHNLCFILYSVVLRKRGVCWM